MYQIQQCIHTKSLCRRKKNPRWGKELRTNTYKKVRIGGEILGYYDFFATYPNNIVRSPAAVGFITPLLLVPFFAGGDDIPRGSRARSSAAVDYRAPLLLIPLVPSGWLAAASVTSCLSSGILGIFTFPPRYGDVFHNSNTQRRSVGLKPHAQEVFTFKGRLHSNVRSWVFRLSVNSK